ncbi:acyl-CoA dehydrogenase family protein [Nocardia callitridis]|uniref:Acyl-CoA dehydrogenase family protein n=1 Tax=Nocardia callitridis TaxID=648753 RepID=A0ABP9KPB6_9NOCA
MTPTASAERELFLSTTRAFLDRHGSTGATRALHAAGASFEREYWRAAAGLGWSSMLVPEEFGGGSVSGRPLADLAAVAECVGRAVAPGPLHPVNIVLAGLVRSAPESHTALIEGLVSGRLVASWAVYEPGRRFDPHSARGVTASVIESGYRIEGVKDRVEAGADSDVFLVTAELDETVRQFVIPRDAPGIRLDPQESIDLTKRYARVTFENVSIPATALLGTARDARSVIAHQRRVAIAVQCAETVGLLDEVLDMTTNWMTERYSFGRPLASYQALKHRLADMTMWAYACRAVTSAAIAAVDAGRADADECLSAAKSYLGEHVPRAIQECIQLHGGIGVTWEHDLHLYLRRATLYRMMLGTPSEHHRALYRREEEATV